MNREDHVPENLDISSSEDSLQGILFETSPYQNVNAIVQHDSQAVYFYLSGDEHFGIRACWVRNLVEAPYVIDRQQLEAGIPPAMPRTHCRHPEPQELPTGESLEVVWFEEGNAAALFEEETPLAVIPPWSGVDGFHGYSSQCVAECQIAWPLPENRSLWKRIEQARLFWDACSKQEEHPFAILQTELLEQYRARFGVEAKYFTLDGGQFPPRAAALYRSKDSLTLLSVGMSLRPQPNVEMSVQHPRNFRRVELAISLPPDIDEAGLQVVLEQFSGLVAWPWIGFTWFGHGHSCEVSSLGPIFGSESTLITFVDQNRTQQLSDVQMPVFRGDPIQLLWLSPASH